MWVYSLVISLPRSSGLCFFEFEPNGPRFPRREYSLASSTPPVLSIFEEDEVYLRRVKPSGCEREEELSFPVESP